MSDRSIQVKAGNPFQARENSRVLRILIADRDTNCRTRVKALLTEEPDSEIVAECSQTDEILSALRKYKPDLLLFDPRLPGDNVFDLLARLPPESLPLLIFITSQDQYALKAFETKAFDFIMKPLEQKRFHQAIERARTDIARTQEATLTRRRMDLIRQVRDVPEERLIVKYGGRIVFIDAHDIDWIEADANYVVIHVKNRMYRMREPIGQIAHRVAALKLARIHRSVIVNTSRIKEIEPCNSGEYIVHLAGGKQLPCSRNYNSAIRSLLHRTKSPRARSV
jgi:two-component system, LytTR family, response regulator